MDQHRRTFLQGMGAGVAAASVLSATPDQVRGAENDKLTVALIGAGGMGTGHLRELAARSDVEIAYVSDVDQNRLAAGVETVSSRMGRAPQGVADFRRILDDKRVDAVFIATPDHWHAPAAILALNAGKHVYVEKPCCHNIREGRLMAEAVAKSGKRLQVGTQSRSTAFVRDAIERLQKGEIGDILVAKAWNSQLRGSIGHRQPSSPPAHLDYDAWLGPAPQTPYQENLLHGIWRWWYEFGCGDIGNDGVHDIDVACWGLGVTTHPNTVSCLGGKYFFDDDQQFPDTQYAVFEYAADSSGKKKQLIFEQRIWSPYVQEGYENGAAFYGTQGLLVMGHTVGWKLYGPKNALIAEASGSADLEAHHTNFFKCIRDSNESLNADVTAGHLSATLVHLANIAARNRRVLEFDPKQEQITNDTESNRLVRRRYRESHWSVPQGV